MEVKQIINSKELATSNTSTTSNLEFNTTSSTSKRYNYECDKLYEELKDLVGDSRFRGYYIKQFYALGREKVLQLASIARADKTNFGYLLKKAVDENGRS